jgi:hypothetical protein
LHHSGRRRALNAEEVEELVARMDDGEFEARVEPICVGPVADGSHTLSEAAHELHQFAVWLIELEREGWQLVHEGEEAHLDVINRDASAQLYEPELQEA